jgi:predicted membrane-bound spermidine synthase
VQTSPGAVIRGAGVTVGGLGAVVLLAIGLGALATRFASANAVFAVALGVTALAALIGGVAAGPILDRLAAHPRIGVEPPDASSPAGDGPE